MNQNQKRNALNSCLTEEQRNMLRENMEMRKQQRNEFRYAACDEQQQQMRQNQESTQTQTRTGTGTQGRGGR